MAKLSILGAGGWALGLAILLNNNGHDVTVWSKVKAELDGIREEGENKKSLPGVKIPKEIKLCEDLKTVVADADIVVMAGGGGGFTFCKKHGKRSRFARYK